MSQHSLTESHAPFPERQAPGTVAPAAPPPPPFEAEEGGKSFSVQRIGRALLRYKGLVFLAAIVAGGAGYVTWRIIDPEYVAEGNLWVERVDDAGGGISPISQGGLLAPTAWIELVRSYAVLDPVVVQEKLYLDTPPNWTWLFGSFELADRFRPGEYQLRISEDGRSWALLTKEGIRAGAGSVGDSIGANVGFVWQPRPQSLEPGAVIDFSVVTPRDASRELSRELTARMDRGANFIGLTLRGKDPQHIASVLNAIMERHVELAAELKRRQLDEGSAILEEQLTYAQLELERAEQELEAFRVATVTLPTDPGTALAPGLEETRDPVFSSFFQMKIDQEQLARDRRRLEDILTGAANGTLSLETLTTVPSAQQSAQLSGAINDLISARAGLRALRTRYEDAYGPVQDLQAQIETLERETIPRLLTAVVEGIRERESELASRIDAAAVDLGNIPARSIEEARLRRQVAIQERFYNDLRSRVETARLMSASSVADVSILDNATAPQVPANDERIRMMLMVAGAILGIGALGAVLLDRMDPTLRDPTELESEIGLMVLGAVPKIGSGEKLNEERVLEAFRELRMNLGFAYGRAGPVVVTISSPSPAEGKSLVSANLAVVFADAGRSTLLIDGDTRRGDVNELLGVERKSGLTDYLGGLPMDSVIQSTQYAHLHFIGSGSRKASSPELLASPRMRDLFSEARARYDVVIVDSPPLTAGADAALLSALTGSLALVVRSGTTQRDMVLAKLDGLRRFPIRVLGAILNDFAETGRGRYQYYANYLPGYEATGEEELGGDVAVALPGGSDSEQAGVV